MNTSSIKFFPIPFLYQTTQQPIDTLCLPLQHRIDHRLNIVARGWGIRPYLGNYLRLDEDDRHGVLENSPVSRHFAMWEEELFKIGVVHFEHLAILLRLGIERGLEDVALVEVGFVVVGVSTLHAWRAWTSRFPSGVAKMCSPHEMDRSRKLLLEIGKIEMSGLTNRMVWFYWFWQQSRVPLALDEGASPLAMWCLDEG
jgi:hypothetical protein